MAIKDDAKVAHSGGSTHVGIRSLLAGQPVEPSLDGRYRPTTKAPVTTDSSQAESSQAHSSQAESSQAHSSQAQSSQAESSQAESSQAESSKPKGSWLAALALLAPIVPVVAIAITITVHYGVEHTGLAQSRGTDFASVGGAMLGVICVIVLWLFAAWLMRQQMLPENSNPIQYAHLLAWQSQFAPKCRLVSLHAPANEEALDEAQSAYKQFKEEFGKMFGGRWTTQSGYLTLYRLRHRAEEAWIGYAPKAVVVAEAWNARLSLWDSKLDEKNRSELQRGLDMAIMLLDPKAWWKYLPDDERNPILQLLNGQKRLGSPLSRLLPHVSSTDDSARNIVRHAIASINAYQDDRYGQLLDIRSQLAAAGVCIGGLSYLLTVFGVVLQPANVERWPELMLGAGTLYLVGAAFGLMYRLYDESKSRPTVEDFGLSTLRILTTPVLSGFAGVAGALFMSIVLNSGTVLQLFDLASHPNGLLYAAIFGLTPNVLINYMHRQANKYIREIESVKIGTTTTHAREQSSG